MAAPELSTGGASGLSLTTTSGIMIAGIMFLLALFLLGFFLYLRRKQYWGTIPAFGRPSAGRLGPDLDPAAAPLPRGLDASAIEALPSSVFRLGGAAEGIECAVCITELADGEAARLLPKCGHAFHLECVDMWLRSHSTCPVCRCAVVPADSAADTGARPADAVSGVAEGTLGVPTGNSGSQEVSPAEEMLAIEIPRRLAERLPQAASPLPSTGSAAEEVRSPAAAATLKTLRRLLVIRNIGLGSSCSPRGRDIEQGIPKAPSSS